MSATTKIEWCDATWSPITGCTPCSPGCDHCYAANMVRRFPALHGTQTYAEHDEHPIAFGRVQFHPVRLDQPLHWRKPRRIFVCSMGDLFHEDVPANWIRYVFHTMRSLRGEHHTYLLLTKRAEAARSWFSVLKHCCSDTLWPLPNVWLGVTVCNQAEADAKIPVLLNTPAALRFVSIEPMLGPVVLTDWLPWRPHGDAAKLDWVICGGETGPGARPMHPVWVRGIRTQCGASGVPFFFKGWGDWAPNCLCETQYPHPTVPRPMPGPIGCMFHCGKQGAGAMLDGHESRQFPEVTP